jgi:hypothetical protein
MSKRLVADRIMAINQEFDSGLVTGRRREAIVSEAKAPKMNQQACGGDGLAGGAFSLIVSLRAVSLAVSGLRQSTTRPYPTEVGSKFVAVEFGYHGAKVSGLDLEPHPVVERQDPLCAARVTLLRNGLGGRHDGMVDLIEWPRQASVGRDR